MRCLVHGFLLGFLAGFLLSFLIGFLLLVCWLVKQPKKVFGKWLLNELKIWLLSQNEKLLQLAF